MVNGRSSIETKDLFSPSHSLRSSLFPHPSTNYFRMWNKNERDEREGFPVDQPSSPIPSSLHSIPFTCPFSFLLFFFHLRVSERNEKTQEGKGEGREEKRGREATWLIPSSSLISISLFCFFYLSSLCHPARCSEGKGWHGKEKERCLSLPCPLSHGCPILIHETVSGERKGKDMPEWPKGTGSEWAVFLFSHLSHINRSHTIPSHCPCRLFRSSPFPRSWPPTWQRSEGSASETREAKGKSWPLPTLLSPTTRKEWNGRSWP